MDDSPNLDSAADDPLVRGRRAPGQVVRCGWCGEAVAIPPRGRVPKWCTSTCRHRAWEQRRAADSGIVAVEVVQQVVEVKATRSQERRTAQEWAKLLTELSDRLDRRRIYDRDLPGLDDSVLALVQAFNCRTAKRPP